MGDGHDGDGADADTQDNDDDFELGSDLRLLPYHTRSASTPFHHSPAFTQAIFNLDGSLLDYFVTLY